MDETFTLRNTKGGGWSEENNQQDLLGKPSHPQKKYIYLEQ